MRQSIDDRGRKLPPVDLADFFGAIWTKGREPAPYRRRILWTWIITSGFVLYVLVMLVSNPTRALSALLPSTGSQWIVFGLMMCIPLFTVRIAPRFAGPFRQSLPQINAWLAAHGRCGACGYDLDAIQVAPDGRVVCPECGSAWHPDRWTLKSDDISTSSLTVDVLLARTGTTFEWCTDDRGVPLDLRGFSIRKWSRQPRASTELAAKLLRQEAFERRRRLRRTFHVVVFAWLVINIAALIIRNPPPRDLVFDIMSVGIVTALIAGIVLYIARRGNVNPRRFRSTLLSHHVCANCGGELDESPPPTFDACRACVHCGRAWKLGESESLTPSAPVSPPSPA